MTRPWVWVFVAAVLAAVVTGAFVVSIWLTLDTRRQVRAVRSDVSDVEFVLVDVEKSLGRSQSPYLGSISVAEMLDDLQSRVEDLLLKLDALCLELNAYCE